MESVSETKSRVLPSVKLGRERDRRIHELIDDTGPYTREQIQLLLFPNHTGPQKCGQRLKKLCDRGKVKRLKFGDTGQYIYFTGAWTNKKEHAILVNWVYTSLVSQKKNWDKVQTFHREYMCTWGNEKLMADALIVIENKTQKTLKPVFLEADQDPNKFEKVLRYTEYYLSKEWTSQWWAQKDKDEVFQFPRILIVTSRPDRTKRAVARDNIHNLRISVGTIDEVREDIYKLIRD